MIAVIADDLTGAAELGGIGLRYNLSVEVALEVDPQSKADLVVIATDARSKPEAEAVAEMVEVSKAIAKLQPGLIFKKVDSVLRGHVLPEIQAQLSAFDFDHALIVPANPALGRTIEDGNYLIYGKPIVETGFKDDPEFPVTSSRITEMLKAEDGQVQVLKHQDLLDSPGVIVGEAATNEDLKAWAKHFGKHSLFSGGAGFFTALLDSLDIKVDALDRSIAPFSGVKLYVSGTAFSNSAIRIESLEKTGLVVYMPSNLFEGKNISHEGLRDWKEEVLKRLKEFGTAIIAIDPKEREGRDISALELRERTALVVQEVFAATEIDELIIEGGSTASAIFRTIGLKTLYPKVEYAPGVIRSEAIEKPGLHVTLKPGSYNWPKEIWSF
ncbi:four-carbon acid sugar kinase family protein [Pedobacter sp. SYSU D00535]|uniref:four-carbon acid sugar kinase family protein n=1 Tax=Pedobacter sp. SYSU D00535 TaxID=2810308 RepID=UPI001A96C824|nr:four-carbon acid sugar kinase family protein [Pedobacter sp. SYSU D00535]